MARAGQFKKGHTGRPKGALNKLSNSKKRLQEVFSNYVEGTGEFSLLEDVSQMTPTDRAKYFQSIAPFVIPKLKDISVTDISEERATELIDELLKQDLT